MIIYITKDDNPEGGYFSFGPSEPALEHYGKHIVEVRKVEGGDLWDRWYNGLLPTDDEGSLDQTLVPLWLEGETVWKRS